MLSRLILALLLLSACGATSKRIVASDGSPAVVIECLRSMSDCYTELSRVCPQGYRLLSSPESQTNVTATSQAMATRTSTTLVAQCTKPVSKP